MIPKLTEQLSADLCRRLSVDGTGIFTPYAHLLADTVTMPETVEAGGLDGFGVHWWYRLCRVEIAAMVDDREVVIGAAERAGVEEGRRHAGGPWCTPVGDDSLWTGLLEDACHAAQTFLQAVGSETTIRTTVGQPVLTDALSQPSF